MKEYEMFPPIKKLFEEVGYTVNAEVKHCDITAVRRRDDGDELVIIEMKTTLNIKLLAQGINRMRSGADVYIAVPKPKNYNGKKWYDILAVIKKLELGLIFVTVSDKFSFAEVVIDPVPFKPTNSYKPKKRAIMEEISARRCDTNTGGVSGRKIVTAYIELSIHIACLLENMNMASPKDFKQFGIDGVKAGNIMRNNPLGWFYRAEKGVYTLSDKWHSDKSLYAEVYEYYSNVSKSDLSEIE